MSRRYLLDTHVWLWFCLRPEKLTDDVSAILADADNELLLSVASAWEIAIKQHLGKLELPLPAIRYLPDRIENTATTILPIQLHHTLETTKLPLHHNDPFDRLLIAQATVERVPVITADKQFEAYTLELIRL